MSALAFIVVLFLRGAICWLGKGLEKMLANIDGKLSTRHRLNDIAEETNC